MDKEMMRSAAKKKRNMISPLMRKEYGELAAQNALIAIESAGAQMVMLYAAAPEELSTWPLMDRLLERGYIPVFPLVRGEDLVPILWDEETVFVSDKRGILQPVGGKEVAPGELELVIVPGLSFDETGNRLGYGKGYYDRFLAHTQALRVGYCFQAQIEKKQMQPEPHDVKMDYICTEVYVMNCTGTQVEKG